MLDVIFAVVLVLVAVAAAEVVRLACRKRLAVPMQAAADPTAAAVATVGAVDAD